VVRLYCSHPFGTHHFHQLFGRLTELLRLQDGPRLQSLKDRMMAENHDLEEQLRNAIESSGLTLYQLAKAAGINYSQVHRFANRSTSLNLKAASQLAAVLGLELRPIRKQKN
jgi:ribosome-binding protein aMBF1 (putative translation factor)